MAYNDEPPVANATLSRFLNRTLPTPKPVDEGGHTKGVLATSSEYGFWLVHSVPKFPELSGSDYKWGSASADYGQTFLCISMSLADIDGVAKQVGFVPLCTYAHVHDFFLLCVCACISPCI